MQDDAAIVNGLSTTNADGKWHLYYTGGDQGDTWNSDTQSRDRTRHRMTNLVEDEEWEYEWVKEGSHLFPDNMSRFVTHALEDNDPYMKENGTYPPW